MKPDPLRILALFAAPLSLQAAEQLDYIRDVQPVLAEHCFQCHGTDEKTRKAGLRLDVREAALKGGESDGPAIVPGKPEASALIARITASDDDVMPPVKTKKPVSGTDLAVLKRWIAEGAGYRGHWAFEQPVKAKHEGHPVDFFVRQRLAKEKLQPSPPASAETLARRLHLDLTGLPPSPAETDAFMKDAAAGGLAKAAEARAQKLLADPAYGEKWARHWLDAARYSDSNGFEKDLMREQWAWRDWVIAAFNRDMPYDQFIIEQIAGDLMPGRSQEQLIATGFLRNGMVNEEGAIVPEQFRIEGVFDRMDCIGKGVMGLSLQCAQCHSHKFDPVSQDEYYGMFAFVNDAHEAQSWVHTAEERKKIAEIQAGVAQARERLKKQHPDWQAKLAAWESGQIAAMPKWETLDTTDQTWIGGLNHPEELADKSVLVLGHPSTSGEMYLIAEPDLDGATGLRLEALLHGDLPFGGPGRSYRGTFAITEMRIETQLPGSDKWEKAALKNATADFSEPESPLEDFFARKKPSSKDKGDNRLIGPVGWMIDGKNETAWRADRGPGLRNTESAAVVQFEKPLALPKGSQIKVSMTFNHGGDGNGRDNVQLGRMRLAITKSGNPAAPARDHAATLAMQTPASERAASQQAAVFDAWMRSAPAFSAFVKQQDNLWKTFPEAETSVLHLARREAVDPRPTKLLDRGVWDRPKHEVGPHTPAALHPMSGGPRDRLAFARWLADKRSPLAARIAVNRVWQAVFGLGLVETSEDFGTRTPMPVHRELLDWLAVDFMEHGWSHKHLIQAIVTSSTYQQSSRAAPALLERDPRNVLLARGPRFRAEAEVVRDIALTAAGLLTRKIGGPSIFPPVPASVLEYNYVKPAYWIPAEDSERYRRSLYLFRKRSMPDPLLSSFDAPSSDAACARRVRSNTPLTALASLNEPVFVEAAQALAQRILKEGGQADTERADYAYRLTTGRHARPAEIETVLKLLAQNRGRLRKGEIKARDIAFSPLAKASDLPADATPNDIAAWAIVGRVLLNLDETLSKN